MTIRRGLALFVATCVVGGASARLAHAQQTLTLTVEEALSRGLATAPRLAEARARETAARAAVSSRQALTHPSFALSSGVLRTNHVDEFGVPQPNGDFRVIFPDIPNNYRLRAELGVPLYTSGRAGALVASARADQSAVEAEHRAAAADLEIEIVSAYWTLVTARARVDVLERAETRAEASVGDVRARVESGILPPNDLLSAQAQRARQRVLLIQAGNEATIAEAQLARLIGAAPGDTIMPSTPVDRPEPAVASLMGQAASDLLERARRDRPERQALADRQASFLALGEAARLATRPQVAAVAAIEPARPNPRFVPRADQWNTAWDLGVNVTWPLWDGGRSRADRAASAAQADAFAARVQDFDAVARIEILQRQLEITGAKAALEASAEAVAAATEARRVLGERFAAGVATSTDVLESDVAMLEAELERTRLLAALRVGEARLVRAVGGARP